MLKLLDTRYHHGDGLEESSCLSILSIVLLIIFLVIGVSYALYLFIDATHISDVSGVHITKNLSLAVSGLRGNLYNNAERGINNWFIFKDGKNNFEISYPNDWEYRVEDNTLFSARLSNKQVGGQDSLAMVVNVGKLRLENEKDFFQVVVGNEQELDPEKLQEEEVDGKMVIHTKIHQKESGVRADTYYWKMDGNILYLQARYYKTDSSDLEQLFNKIVGEFKIT